MVVHFRAATGLAVALVLATFGFAADSGYAFNLDQDMNLGADDISVDAAVVAVDDRTLNPETLAANESAEEKRILDEARATQQADPAVVPAQTSEGQVAHGVAPLANAPAQRVPPISLAALVADQTLTDAPNSETRCLASAVYFEAKSESLTGQLAVANVILNRVAAGRFAGTVCGVVHQKGQFSFIRGGLIPAVPTASRDWREALAIAMIARDNLWESPIPGALYFHARRVSPRWRLTRLGSVENHIFYR